MIYHLLVIDADTFMRDGGLTATCCHCSAFRTVLWSVKTKVFAVLLLIRVLARLRLHILRFLMFVLGRYIATLTDVHGIQIKHTNGMLWFGTIWGCIMMLRQCTIWRMVLIELRSAALLLHIVVSLRKRSVSGSSCCLLIMVITLLPWLIHGLRCGRRLRYSWWKRSTTERIVLYRMIMLMFLKNFSCCFLCSAKHIYSDSVVYNFNWYVFWKLTTSINFFFK